MFWGGRIYISFCFERMPKTKNDSTRAWAGKTGCVIAFSLSRNKGQKIALQRTTLIGKTHIRHRASARERERFL